MQPFNTSVWTPQQLWGADHTDSRHGENPLQTACCAASWKHELLHWHQSGTCEFEYRTLNMFGTTTKKKKIPMLLFVVGSEAQTEQKPQDANHCVCWQPGGGQWQGGEFDYDVSRLAYLFWYYITSNKFFWAFKVSQIERPWTVATK